MSSNWIKVEVITPDKPEVYQLAELLDIDPDAALGKLIRLWAWADQQTIDGKTKCNAVSVTKNAVDRITFVKGFADALISIGWLTVDDSTLKFPNFERHNGNSSKKRVLTNQRVTKSRKMKRSMPEECNAESVTPAFQKALPEIEIDKEKERDLPPTPHRGRRASARLDPLTVELPDWLPEPLWAEWVGFRQQLGKPIRTKQGIAESLKNLAKFRKQGHLPETVIRQSIANEWQGLFEPKSAPRQAGMTPLETSYTGIPPGFQESYEP